MSFRQLGFDEVYLDPNGRAAYLADGVQVAVDAVDLLANLNGLCTISVRRHFPVRLGQCTCLLHSYG